MSDYDRSRILACWDCDLSFRNIVPCIGRNPMTLCRIWNRWVQEGNMERCARFQRFTITDGREDKHLTRMVLINSTFMSEALNQECVVCKTTNVCTISSTIFATTCTVSSVTMVSFDAISHSGVHSALC